MKVVKMPVALITTFLWIGFVSAISFMESWIKFKAPGVTLPIGLGIGNLVFNALNNVELVLAIIILVSIFISETPAFSLDKIFYYCPLIILLLQTFWLLPVMNTRAELQIKGEPVPNSHLHFYYVGMEVTKVICLFAFGLTLFRNINKTRI